MLIRALGAQGNGWHREKVSGDVRLLRPCVTLPSLSINNKELSREFKAREKLRDKHGVVPEEIEQCFYNRIGRFLEDVREEHRTHPPTQWFIAETDTGRRLKVVFVEDVITDDIDIKTAYEPNAVEENIYDKHC